MVYPNQIEQIQKIIDAQVLAQDVITFSDLLAKYLSLIELPALNDSVVYDMVISDLQEYHDYSLTEAEEKASHISETIVGAMWDEYSHVLSECVEGRY